MCNSKSERFSINKRNKGWATCKRFIGKI